MLGDDAVDRGTVESLKQGNSFAQGRFKRDIAAHGAFRDRRDMRLLADFSGEFVNTFLADHGGIHVGEQEPLAPPFRLLHDDINGGIAET